MLNAHVFKVDLEFSTCDSKEHIKGKRKAGGH